MLRHFLWKQKQQPWTQPENAPCLTTVIPYPFTWRHRAVMNRAVIMLYNELSVSGYCVTSRKYVCSFFHAFVMLCYVHACGKWAASERPEGPQKHPGEHPEGPLWDIGLGYHWKNPYVRFQGHLMSFKQFKKWNIMQHMGSALTQKYNITQGD